MSEVDTMLETMLELDWKNVWLDPLYKALPAMEDNYSKNYIDQALELAKKVKAGTMSPEEAAAYWQDVIVSTKDEWYASVLRKEHQDYINPRIPEYFRKSIDLAQLHNPDAYRQVMNWLAPEIKAAEAEGKDSVPLNNFKGLICIGKSGMGKTRSVYARLIELNYKYRLEFIALPADKLADNIRIKTMIGLDEANDYLKDFITIPILFIDDISLIHLTPKVSQYLLQLFDKRTLAGRPILLTSQLAGDDLIAKYVSKHPDLQTTAEAIVRRIRDFCIPVDFDYLADVVKPDPPGNC